MAKSSLFGKDVVTTQELSVPEIKEILKLAAEMKADRYGKAFTSLLQFKTFIMLFYNPSLRTRQSFEAAATELGGHAQFIEPKAMRLRSVKSGICKVCRCPDYKYGGRYLSSLPGSCGCAWNAAA